MERLDVVRLGIMSRTGSDRASPRSNASAGMRGSVAGAAANEGCGCGWAAEGGWTGVLGVAGRVGGVSGGTACFAASWSAGILRLADGLADVFRRGGCGGGVAGVPGGSTSTAAARSRGAAVSSGLLGASCVAGFSLAHSGPAGVIAKAAVDATLGLWKIL